LSGLILWQSQRRNQRSSSPPSSGQRSSSPPAFSSSPNPHANDDVDDLDELDREPLSERDPDLVDDEEEEEGEELIGEGMEKFVELCISGSF
jgi:hypothetical protein